MKSIYKKIVTMCLSFIIAMSISTPISQVFADETDALSPSFLPFALDEDGMPVLPRATQQSFSLEFFYNLRLFEVSVIPAIDDLEADLGNRRVRHDLSNIRVGIYSSEFMGFDRATNMFALIFGHTFAFYVYTDANGIAKFDRPSDYLLIRVDLSSIPGNTVIDSQTILFHPDETSGRISISNIHNAPSPNFLRARGLGSIRSAGVAWHLTSGYDYTPPPMDNNVETHLNIESDDFFIIVELKSGLYGFKPGTEEVILRSANGFITILDTRNNTIGKNYDSIGRWEPPTGHPHFIETEFRISERDLKEIYNNIIKHDIQMLDGASFWPDSFPLLPHRVYRVTFNMNGTIYTFSYDVRVIWPYDMYAGLIGLLHFHNYLLNFITNTDEFRSFPPHPFSGEAWLTRNYNWPLYWQGQWHEWFTSRQWIRPNPSDWGFVRALKNHPAEFSKHLGRVVL